MSAGLLFVSATDPDGRTGIGRAVAEAGPGATITVRPGVYREELVLGGDVTVVAEEGPGTVVIDTSAGAGLLVAAGRVRLRDIEIRGGHPQMPSVQVTGGSLYLEGCDVRCAGVAAVHLSDGELRLRGTSVRNREGAGLVIDAGSAEIVDSTVRDVTGTAIVVSGDARALFRGCTVQDVGGAGILVTGSSAPVFETIRLARVEGPALVAQEDARPQFHETVVESAGAGLYVTGRAAPSLRSCRLTGSRGPGVILRDEADPVLVDCVVGDPAGHGIHAVDRAAGTFTRCRVLRGAAAGAVLDDDAVTTVDGGEITECAEAGVLVTGRSGPVLKGITLRGNPVGVSVEGTARPELRGLRIRGGRVGVRITGTARADLASTTIDGTEDAGLVVDAKAEAQAVDCEFTGGKGVGVGWHPGSVGALRDCRVTGNLGPGVVVASADGVTLTDSTIRDNAGGDLRLTVPETAVTTTGLRTGEPAPPAPDEPRREMKDDEAPTPAPVAAPRADPADRADPTDRADPADRIDPPGPDPVKGVLGELDSLVGLASVKRDLSTLVGLHRLAERRARAGMLAPPTSRHLAFTGPPGTGKTTVAGIYGRLLAALGVLSQGHLVEVEGAALADAGAVAAAIGPARGGVLLIDRPEAVAGDRPEQAADALIALVEEYGDDLVVVTAGDARWWSSLLAARPALGSRFGRTLEFGGYDGGELVAMVDGLCRTHHYTLQPQTREALRAAFEIGSQTEGHGQARAAARAFEQMLDRQADRLAQAPDIEESELALLRPEDVGRPGEPPG